MDTGYKTRQAEAGSDWCLFHFKLLFTQMASLIRVASFCICNIEKIPPCLFWNRRCGSIVIIDRAYQPVIVMQRDYMGTKVSKANPRYANGTLRRKYRARLKAMGAPCGICGGVIHYDEPSDAKHPLSFVVDEIRPISRYKEFGYRSKREAAEDFSNLQAAHYCCNLAKSNRTQKEMQSRMNKAFMQTQVSAATGTISDGNW